MDGQACCLQSNGKFCTRLDSWQSAAAPASWRGRDNTTAAGQSGAAEEWRQGRSGGSASEEEEQGWEGGSGEDSGEDSGKPWRKATATYFNSYPPCCTNEGADQTECDEFSGCEVGEGWRPLPARVLACRGAGAACLGAARGGACV